MTETHQSQTDFSPTGRIHLAVSLIGPPSELDFADLRTLAQTAERGLFSFLSLDQRYWLGDDPGTVAATDPAGSNDAATMLAAIAAVTTSIGVVVAAAPDYDNPAGLVHGVATLGKLSGGRAAWHMMADAGQDSAASAGTTGSELRDGGDGACTDSRRALLESAQRTWQAWKPSQATTSAVAGLGAFEHQGHTYSLGLGMLGDSEVRDGPVLIHDGGSAPDNALAARHAEIVFTAPAGLEEALAFRRNMVASGMDAGRGANDLKIIQAATFILAATELEARSKAEAMRAQLPEGAWDDEAFVGTPSGVAEQLLNFARTGAVDGFVMMPWMFPNELADVVNHLVPELQRLGIYPRRYATNTLRGNLGIAADARQPVQPATLSLPVVEADELGDVRLDLNLRMELVVAKTSV